MSEVAREINLEPIFSQSDLTDHEISARRFVDLLMYLLGFTIERAQEMLSRLVEIGRVTLSDRYTVVLGA